MPSVEINEKLYGQIKKFAEFIRQPMETIIEDFLEKDIECLKDTPENIFQYFLTYEQIIGMVFGSE
ncbi:MAG: hypothetical protein ACFE9V_18800 [Candidatus Hodarchaeota archaeon]